MATAPAWRPTPSWSDPRLWRELHEQETCDDEHLTGWLLKYHKVSSMRFLTLEAARKCIVA